MAQYPTSAGTDANLFVAVNNLACSLSGAHNAAVTTITVNSTTGFPTAGYITIDSEAISYTGTTGTTFTGCTRGADSTTAASHTDLTQVKHTAVAAHHNVLKDELKAVEGDLVGLKASIVPVTATDTATNVLNRVAMIASQLKNGFGLTNWYDAVTAMLPKTGGTLTGDLNIERSFSGDNVWAFISNTSNTANSAASLLIKVAGTSAFDPYIYFLINGSTAWGVGVDNSDSDRFKISQSSGVGSNDALVIDPTSLAVSAHGTTTNDNPAAGFIGEYVSAVNTSNLAAAATNTYDDGVSISLTAGDWDVSAAAVYEGNGANWTVTELGISATSGNNGAGLVGGQNDMTMSWAATTTVPASSALSIPAFRVSLTSTTTYYLKRRFVYSSGAPRNIGIRLSARRVR